MPAKSQWLVLPIMLLLGYVSLSVLLPPEAWATGLALNQRAPSPVQSAPILPPKSVSPSKPPSQTIVPPTVQQALTTSQSSGDGNNQSSGPADTAPGGTGTAVAQAQATLAAMTLTTTALAGQAAVTQAHQTFAAAETEVKLGTLTAGTVIVGEEHAIQTENAQGFATQTAAAMASVNPTKPLTSTPTPTPTITSVPMPTASATGAPSAGNFLGLDFSGLGEAGFGLAIGAVVAGLVLLGLLATVLFLRIRTSDDKPLPGMAVGALTPRLVLASAPGKTFRLDKSPATIGRDEKHTVNLDASIPNVETVSRRHARIERRGDRYVLVDGAQAGRVSASGIFVNGKRTRENFIKNGDRIGIGQVEFIFMLVPKA